MIGIRSSSAFVARRREALTAALDCAVPRRSKDTLLLATWNLREFDTPGYGVRSDECLGYLAQVIARFELVALQEVREDLGALRRLMAVLGPHWAFLVTDVTEGRAGNGERLAYLYDARKVRLGGLVGEVVLPGAKRQFARTPFTVGFEALGSSLQLCTVHVFYGTAKAVDPRRLAEIRAVAEWLAARTKEDSSWTPNVCLLGDFNIFRRTDRTYKPLRAPASRSRRPCRRPPVATCQRTSCTTRWRWPKARSLNAPRVRGVRLLRIGVPEPR